MSSNNEYSKYLDPSYISKLNSLELKAKSIVEGFMVGLHKSPYHGFSAEFSEHRAYMQGDSIKNVDWKVFGKTDKYYIKQFEEETNLISHIILDSSSSMGFKHSGSMSKSDYGKVLAASLLYIMIKQQDAVGFASYSDKPDQYVSPKSFKTHINNILKTLDNISATGKTNTAECLSKLADKIKKRGIVILISDFFDDPDELIRSLKMFKYKKNEVLVFQILDPIEKSFDFENESKFIDLETQEKITTQPYQIQQSYKKVFAEYLKKLSSECFSNGIEYNLVTTDTPFDKAIFSYYKKRNLLI